MNRPIARHLPRFPILALAAAALLLAPLRALAEDLDLWFTIELAGQKAGWQRLTTTTDGDRITSRSELRMSVRRGQATTDLAFLSEFVETAAGEPVSMRAEDRTGQTPIVTEYTFNAETIEVVSRQGAGEPQRSEVALPEGRWLPPGAAAEYLIQRLGAGADKVTLRTMDPTLGPQAITVTRDLIEKTTVTAGPPGAERQYEVWRCNVRQSVAEDLLTIEMIDARGVPVITETKLGGLDMRIALSDEATATRPAPAPEMLVSVFVRPDKPIRAPRRTVEASYVVRTAQGPLPDLPTAGAQRFERLGAQQGRITVDALKSQPAPDVERAAYLAATPLLDSGDELIQRLARRATGGAGNSPEARAEAMRRFVHQHIRAKGLDVGFASASEVARAREGDCTEHATLLAALLRAEGIPSRVVSGLIYADRFAGEEQIFGYHMWTQALLEIDGQQRWVDLDATLDGRAFDAAHIAVATSSLATGALDAMLVVGQLLGNLEIAVESAE
ncbi:MAG: transglutaminase family protein [Phycisphaerales bacterium JB039]